MWPESYYSTLLWECARYSNVTRARIQFPTLKIREHRFNRHTVQTSHYFVAVNVMKPVEQYCRCLVSGHLCGKADTQRWYKGGASTPLRSFTLGSLLLKDEVPVLDFHAYQQVGQQTSLTCVWNQHHSESYITFQPGSFCLGQCRPWTPIWRQIWNPIYRRTTSTEVNVKISFSSCKFMQKKLKASSQTYPNPQRNPAPGKNIPLSDFLTKKDTIEVIPIFTPRGTLHLAVPLDACTGKICTILYLLVLYYRYLLSDWRACALRAR